MGTKSGATSSPAKTQEKIQTETEVRRISGGKYGEISTNRQTVERNHRNSLF